MMLTRQRVRQSLMELNLTSMIDMTFLLLIFFMCTSAFAQPEGDMPTQVPQISSGKSTSELPPIRIELALAGDGIMVTCDGQVCVDFPDLTARLKERRAVADVAVIIEGQGGVPFGDMVSAMDCCYQADLWRVAFSAKGTGP